MKNHPRWYCTACKRDVKLLTITNDTDSVQQCPICAQASAVFLQFTPRPRRHSPEVSHSPFLKTQTKTA